MDSVNGFLLSTFYLGLASRRHGRGDEVGRQRAECLFLSFLPAKSLYPRPWFGQVALILLLPSLDSGTCSLPLCQSPAGGITAAPTAGVSALSLVGFLKFCLQLWLSLC